MSYYVRITPYKRALESAKVNVVGASRSYVIVWYLLPQMCTRAYSAAICVPTCTPRSILRVHAECSESTRVTAVTTLDVCGTLLRNLTLALSKARLYVAIRSTALSFPSYVLLMVSI